MSFALLGGHSLPRSAAALVTGVCRQLSSVLLEEKALAMESIESFINIGVRDASNALSLVSSLFYNLCRHEDRKSPDKFGFASSCFISTIFFGIFFQKTSSISAIFALNWRTVYGV